ncbi:MAG: transcription termination/antitermination NusG family protein, partial [Candidatus Sulfotelmatobacter sp.]
MLDDSWFAVQTESRREQVAAHLLAQKGYECFLPTYAPSRPRRASAHADDKPLFPGYLFCRMTPGISAKLITTPAVLRIVSFGGRTAFISGQEIEHLKLVVRSGLPREPIPHLLPGNRVRIKSGPLE